MNMLYKLRLKWHTVKLKIADFISSIYLLWSCSEQVPFTVQFSNHKRLVNREPGGEWKNICAKVNYFSDLILIHRVVILVNPRIKGFVNSNRHMHIWRVEPVTAERGSGGTVIHAQVCFLFRLGCVVWEALERMYLQRKTAALFTHKSWWAHSVNRKDRHRAH